MQGSGGGFFGQQGLHMYVAAIASMSYLRNLVNKAHLKVLYCMLNYINYILERRVAITSVSIRDFALTGHVFIMWCLVKPVGTG